MARKRRGWSEGSVFQRADGRWVGSVSLGLDGNGKRKRRTIYGDSKSDVQTKLRALQTSADAGAIGDATRLTVGEFMTRWLENTARPQIALGSYLRYEQIIRLHIIGLIGGVQLARLRAPNVESFYAQLERRGDSAPARKRIGSLLSRALRHAVRLGLIPFNPAADVARARPQQKEMLFLTESQVRQFLDAAQGTRLYPILAVAVGTGMRQGELLALRWPDLDFDAGTVSVQRTVAWVKSEFVVKEPKSRAGRRTITLPPFALDALRQHRVKMLAEGNITAPVFCTKTGNYIAKSHLVTQSLRPALVIANQRATERACGGESALLPRIRFHDLRHTHASLLLSQGHSIKAVSTRLGHAKADVTLRVYAHVLPNDDKKLADGLGRLYG